MELLDTRLGTGCELLANVLCADTGIEYEVEIDYRECTASVVACRVDGLETSPTTLDDGDKLRVELWASRSLELRTLHHAMVERARLEVA